MRLTPPTVCLLALSVACSAEESGLYGNSPGNGDAAGQGAQGGESGGSSPGGSAGAPAGGVAGGGSAGQGGTNDTGGAAGLGGGGGGGDAGGGGTAQGGTGGSPVEDGVGVITCGDSECLSDIGERCCRQQDNLWCEAGDCTCEGFGCQSDAIECDGPEDCSGQICCHDRTLFAGDVSCVENCDDEVTGGKDVVCDPTAPEPCNNGENCVPANDLPHGYFVCD